MTTFILLSGKKLVWKVAFCQKIWRIIISSNASKNIPFYYPKLLHPVHGRWTSVSNGNKKWARREKINAKIIKWTFLLRSSRIEDKIHELFIYKVFLAINGRLPGANLVWMFFLVTPKFELLYSLEA